MWKIWCVHEEPLSLKKEYKTSLTNTTSTEKYEDQIQACAPEAER